MPKETANAEAILEAIKKIEIVSELLADKNKNNLKMIAEGKVSGGKQIGPYAHLLTYSAGEVITSQGDWGGNTFYFSVDGAAFCWASACSRAGAGYAAGRYRDPKAVVRKTLIFDRKIQSFGFLIINVIAKSAGLRLE